MKSCIRMLIRRICLKKGLFSGILLLYIIGFLCVYHFIHRTNVQNLQVDSGPRNVKTVSVLRDLHAQGFLL